MQTVAASLVVVVGSWPLALSRFANSKVAQWESRSSAPDVAQQDDDVDDDVVMKANVCCPCVLVYHTHLDPEFPWKTFELGSQSWLVQ